MKGIYQIIIFIICVFLFFSIMPHILEIWDNAVKPILKVALIIIIAFLVLAFIYSNIFLKNKK